ncbi:MAG: SGNH/GDSL hydrolase family protein [Roseivirga sp.]
MSRIHYTFLISALFLFTLMTPHSDIAAQEASKTYLALGDSYTIGESVSESERWPVQLAARAVGAGVAMATPKIIARTGWRTDELIDAIAKDKDLEESYDLVSLLIGVNNQYQGKSVESFAPEFEQLLQTAIKLAGDNHRNVIVLSIPDYGKTPFGAAKEKEVFEAINTYNKVSREICKKYKVRYFNITPISRKAKGNPELTAEDKLHPSGKMYKEWVGLIENHVIKRLKK